MKIKARLQNLEQSQRKKSCTYIVLHKDNEIKITTNNKTIICNQEDYENFLKKQNDQNNLVFIIDKKRRVKQ